MLFQQLINTAQCYPHQPALQFAEHHWNWQQFLNSVERISQGLHEHGIQSGHHVGLWVNNSPCFIFSLFAILARGAIAVPLNPAMKSADYSYHRITLDAMITTQNLFQQCLQVIAQPELQYFVCPNPDTCQNWDLMASNAIDFPRLNLANEPALLMYSSGSTGQPKALYRTHKQCLAEIQQFKGSCQVSDKDVIFCALPLFHSHGLGNALFAAIGSGASLVLMKNPQPFALQWQRALELLDTQQVTIFPTVPYLLEILVNGVEQSSKKYSLKNLRLCFSAGSALPPNLYQQCLKTINLSVRQLYGCTEAGSVTINLDKDISNSSASVGRVIQGIKIRLLNHQGKPVNEGETGEIALYSHGLSTGYLDEAQLNQQCFNKGWFISGDMGKFDKAGCLHIVGRTNAVIMVAGHKIYSQEVESLLLKHPDIAEVAVIAVNDEQTEQAIKAFIVSKPARAISELTLNYYCKAHISQFKRPKYFIFVKNLPKTALGKIAKEQLS